MLEISNKIMNIGRVKFIEFVLDVLQLFTFEEFHYAIAKIIKQVTCQEGFATKVLLALSEMKEIFALGMQSTSSTINLLVSSTDS